ncbi:24071_t:CDS:2, partial [Racocetra persica]
NTRMGRLKSQNKHLKNIRKLRECEQIKKLKDYINNPPMLLNHLIPKFSQLNNDDFNFLTKKIHESREMNISIQRQLLDYLIPSFEQLNDNVFSYIIKKIFESKKIDICVQKQLLDHLIPSFKQLNDNDFNFILKKLLKSLESRKMNMRVQKQLHDHLIPSFEQLNDDDFNSTIKKIFESREMNTYVQRKRNDIFMRVCNLPDQQIFNALNLFQTMIYSQGIYKGEIISTYLQKKACEFIVVSLYQHNHTINVLELKISNLKKENQLLKKNRYAINNKFHSLSAQIIKAKQSKIRQTSKIRSSIRKAKKIRPVQFRRAVNRLFRVNNKEYSAKFVKLATNIKNIYRLFGDELVDAEHELDTINFENFRESLRTGIENALDGFVKWME